MAFFCGTRPQPGVSKGSRGNYPGDNIEGFWQHTPLPDTMIKLGLEELEIYTARRHNTVVQYIATRLLLDLFLEAEKWIWARVEK